MPRRIKYRSSSPAAENQPSVEQETIKNCPILYRDAHKSCQETCMCWGWECGHGWDEELQKLSYKLEALNMQFYPQYRVRIQADQVKEKYGTLHFYYSVILDRSKLKTWLHDFCYRRYDAIRRNVDFKYKRVVDQPKEDYDDVKEITQEEYDRQLKSAIRCSNVEYEQKDGKIYKTVHLTRYEKTHLEPCAHKLTYKLMNFWLALHHKLSSYGTEATADQEVIISYMSQMAEKLIDETEDELYSTCECCGSSIGYDEQNPRCTTAGWIRYLCKECADKGCQYYTDKGLWEKGTLLKTQEQLDCERKEREAKYDAEHASVTETNEEGKRQR